MNLGLFFIKSQLATGKELQRNKGETERSSIHWVALPSTGSLFQMPATNSLKPEAKNPIWIFQAASRGPNTWAIFYCFSHTISRELNQKWRSSDMNRWPCVPVTLQHWPQQIGRFLLASFAMLELGNASFHKMESVFHGLNRTEKEWKQTSKNKKNKTPETKNPKVIGHSKVTFPIKQDQVDRTKKKSDLVGSNQFTFRNLKK